MVTNLVLEVSRLYPPPTWCLPAWHSTVTGLDRRWGSKVIRSGCLTGEDGAIPCRPEAMRADAEAKLRALGAWPSSKKLTLNTYALARNINSEFGSGTPEERVAVAFSSVNRAKRDHMSVAEHVVHKQNHLFGRQQGSTRPVSTAQDPTAADVLLAELILRGEISDITHGATHYFDRVAQDAAEAKGSASLNGVGVYRSWSSGGDQLTWVGHIPNVRPWRLLLMREMKGEPNRSQVIQAGLLAVQGKNRAPDPWPVCAADPRARFVIATSMLVGGLLGGIFGPRFRPRFFQGARARRVPRLT